MNEIEHYNNLKEIAFGEGALLFGVADVSGINARLKYGISIGYVLSKEILNSIEDSPTLIYCDHYVKVNAILDNIALKIHSYIIRNEHGSFPVSASHITDWVNVKGFISHKRIGLSAGLGWIGKNNLLVNPKYGSQVRYASVLTDLPLKLDKAIEGNCGGCSSCIKVCPAKAIGEDSYDLETCKKQLREFSKKPAINRFICGMCLKVCQGGKP